jgi:anti-anti-sigma factor
MRTDEFTRSAVHTDEAVRCEYTRQDGVGIVRASGEIDLSNIHRFEELLDRAIAAEDSAVVVDLTKAASIDSAGLNALMRIYERAKERHLPFGVATATASIRRLFSLVSLQNVAVFSSVEDALRRVRETAATE